MADASIHKISMLVHLTERGEWREVCDAVETVGKGQKEVGHLKHQDEDNDVAFSVLSKNSPVILETRESFNIQCCFKSTQTTRSR